MQLNKHGSFYIRNGWPTKIIDALCEDNHVFSPNNELQAVDSIGVGRVMIKAMRYWACVLGIATEGKDQQGIFHNLTPLASLIHDFDPYCADVGTLWLLHRNLTQDYDNATAWNWAFNIFDESVFTKDDFSNALNVYIHREGYSYAKKAVEKEFDCFKNTYVTEQAFSIHKIIEEDTIPFFAPLQLLEYKGAGHFERRRIHPKDIPTDIFYACILKDNESRLSENRQISIEHLLESSCQVGRYMNLSYSSLISLLEQLENERYLRLINNFGNRHIEVNELDANAVLQNHYQLLGR